jgi:hypothetical protein
MIHRTLIVIAAVLGIERPGHAHAGETPTELVEHVTALHDAMSYAAAAKLADEGARREDFTGFYRVLLGGLAKQNFELSFKSSGLLTELCKAADIMRHVAPFDSVEGGVAKLKAAADTEKMLEQLLGPTWGATCSPVAEDPVKESTAGTNETAATGEIPRGTAAGANDDAGPVTVEQATTRESPGRSSLPRMEIHDRRVVRAGLGTLVPGLVLFAPMAALLAYRADGERDLTALDLETTDRARTVEDDKAAASFGQRYTATTAGAIALGVTGAALVVTGAVLLRTGKRHQRMAVAPWGARGVGGLVLEKRF